MKHGAEDATEDAVAQTKRQIGLEARLQQLEERCRVSINRTVMQAYRVARCMTHPASAQVKYIMKFSDEFEKEGRRFGAGSAMSHFLLTHLSAG